MESSINSSQIFELSSSKNTFLLLFRTLDLFEILTKIIFEVTEVIFERKFDFSSFRNNDKTAVSSHYDISSSRVLQNEKNGILRVDVLRGSLALCVWKVAKTIITIPITLRVGLVTWKNINSCIRWYYHLKNSQNVTFNEFSNITSECQNGSWRTRSLLSHRTKSTLSMEVMIRFDG